MGGRCRKCGPCKVWAGILRKADWVSRAVWEILASDGNAWFLTLTFRFKPKEGEGYGDFQKFAKRVRKARGKDCKIRYICASEFGERNGRYHLHAIILGHGRGLSRRDLRSKWTGGYSHARAIDPNNSARAARYISKYLAKVGRIHASNGFGNQIERVNLNVSRTSPTTAAVLAAFPGAKVTAIKEAGQARCQRAPYHLRRPVRFVPDPGPRVWYGERPTSSDGLLPDYPAHWVHWGPFSALPEPVSFEGAEGG